MLNKQIKRNLLQFEKQLNYEFKKKELLLKALTHSSYAYERQQEEISDNEVLEFLGDSVLGLIAADYLCSQYPELSEGELSKLKSAASNTSALFYFARKIKLDKYILLGKGEEKSGARKTSVKENTILCFLPPNVKKAIKEINIPTIAVACQLEKNGIKRK